MLQSRTVSALVSESVSIRVTGLASPRCDTASSTPYHSPADPFPMNRCPNNTATRNVPTRQTDKGKATTKRYLAIVDETVVVTCEELLFYREIVIRNRQRTHPVHSPGRESQRET